MTHFGGLTGRFFQRLTLYPFSIYAVILQKIVHSYNIVDDQTYTFSRRSWISQEAVLIQAWKKASSYIRYHNSFADTLALDHVTANLPEFIANIQERIKSSDQWKNDPLRIVPAPKSQDWQVTSDRWGRIPQDTSERSAKMEQTSGGTDIHLRPLAHVSLADQVIATAIMLCLADWVESKMGDPREKINKRKKRKKVIAYGNRLFCDLQDGKLSHRWGSTKLYQSYFQDYRKFLSRPKKVAELYSKKKKNNRDIYIIEADLSKFYDRVTPDLLSRSLKRLSMSKMIQTSMRLFNLYLIGNGTQEIMSSSRSTKNALN